MPNFETIAQAKTMFKPYSRDMMMRVVDVIRREAKRREDDAEYGRCDILRAEIDCFLAGLRGTLPERWREFIDMAEHEADPEYAEYQRLKQKFEASQ